MAISFVNQAASSASSVSTATHAVGDLLAIVWWRTLSTIPADPGSPWITDSSGTGGSIGYRLVHTIATATNDSSGTLTSSFEQYAGYRGASGIGAVAFNSGTSNTPIYPALTLQDPGNSWVMRVGWHNSATNFSTATLTGYIQRQLFSTTGQALIWDSNGPVSSVTADSQSAAQASAVWRTLSIEILASASSKGKFFAFF